MDAILPLLDSSTETVTMPYIQRFFDAVKEKVVRLARIFVAATDRPF